MAFVVGAALQAQFATVMNKATQKTTNLEKAVKNLQKANWIFLIISAGFSQISVSVL